MRILHLEDSKPDAILIARMLRAAWPGVEILLVDSRAGYEAALAQADFDIILSDYSMPGFDGMAALEMARRRFPDKPFIFVSGRIGEERAIEALNLGASDYVIKDRPGRLVFAIERAVERRREEAKSQRQQRVESIGIMAGGIAYDLNNVLSPILAAVNILKSERSPTDLMLTNLIEQSATHGADLVRQLMAFARGSEERRIEIQVGQQISLLQTILRPALSAGIRLRLSFSQPTWPISVDATQFDQVILNLCLNARDAMPNGGQVEISAQNVIVNHSRYVQITVSDTGTSIAPEIVAKVFEPFFTTKAAGKGNGLGLAMVTSIVKSHQGFVRLESQVGTGTSFFLCFPADPLAASPKPGRSRAGKKLIQA